MNTKINIAIVISKSASVLVEDSTSIHLEFMNLLMLYQYNK